MSVKESLEQFGKRVVTQSRSNLSKAKKRDRGELYDSLKYEVTQTKGKTRLSITMADYGVFVDKGVKGKSSSAKAPNSPFQFGSGTGEKGGLSNGIVGWTSRKRIQFKDRKTGKFLTYKATAFLIARSIYQKGLRTTNFFTNAYRNEFEKLPQEILTEYKNSFTTMLQKTFKQ